ncbi:hypothetical protein BDZ97DRAFT_1661869 [Flammula alnicola]|nr:hypothetical protein BDZ97DRAFT_1661869 [Flammula alnicola]
MAALWTNLVQPFLLLTAWLFGEQNDATPSSCLRTAQTIEALVTCFDTFTVPHDYYNSLTYDLAQPVGTQRKDWKVAVQSVLSVDGNCSTTAVPLSLHGLYTIDIFKGYCVLYETATRCGTYLKGWGFMIAPAYHSSVSRSVHISAPHPGYDLGTVEQAASIFDSTGSKSLLVAGRKRTAFLDQSNCIARVLPKQDYYKTDPAHNNDEPFFDASISIYNWQHQHYGCPSSSCGFIQLHGKGSSTCSSETIFLSSGLGNSSASRSWYSDDTDRPVKRLQRNLQHAFPAWKVSLPSDSNCPLTATKNVVGRHLNGIHLENVCSMGATSKTVTGEFLHAEQAGIARNERHYKAWSQALVDTFDVTCAEGMVLDPMTQLCAVARKPVDRVEEGASDSRRLNALMDPPKWNQWYLFMSYFMIL